MKSLIVKNRKIIPSLLWRALKWHVSFVLTRKPRPLAASVNLTNKCNFRCTMCNIWRKPVTEMLPFEKARSIVDDLGSLGCFYISFGGGEPLLAEYLFDLLTHAKKTKIKYVHLVTNGYLIDAPKARRFRDSGLDEISISMDGPKDFHNKNRGVADAYQKAVTAIENLKKYAPGVNVGLNAIFFPQDPFQCFHVVELARQYDCLVKVQPVNQHPLFNEQNYVLTAPGDISPAKVKEALEGLRKEERIINSDVFLKNIYNFFFDKDNLVLSRTPCYFGYHHLEVLEDGTLFPCIEGMGWKGGFGFQENLRSLLASGPYRKLCKKLKACERCKHTYYICYYEPRIVFPITNFLKSMLS